MSTTGYIADQQDHYISLKDAVALGYGAYSTLRRRIDSGELPAVKIGHRVKVRRSDLDALALPKRGATFEDIASAVQRIADSAPALSAEQVHSLASLFGGAR